MYWLWKWLESYNNCTFLTWKDKFLFNLLFWILTRFAHFMIMLGEELPCLPWRPVTDFLSFRFLNNFLSLKNRVALKLFTLMKYFYLSGLLSHLWIALKNRVCPEFTVLNIYISNHSEFRTTCACPEKQSLPWKFSLHWNNNFWGTCACSENRVFLKYFTVLNIVFTFRIFEQLALSLKKRVHWIHCIEYIFFILQNFEQPALALKFFTAMKYFLSFRIFEQLVVCPEKQSVPWIHCIEDIFFIIQNIEQPALAMKNKICPEIFKLGGRPPPLCLVRRC